MNASFPCHRVMLQCPSDNEPMRVGVVPHFLSLFLWAAIWPHHLTHSPPSKSLRRFLRKCGAGRQGVGAKYCSMSPWQRKEQFPTEPFEVRISDKGVHRALCKKLAIFHHR